MGIELIAMALEPYISKFKATPAHCFHPPPFDQPLRIRIEGPTIGVERLLPGVSWHTDTQYLEFPQPAAGPELANLAFRVIYRREPEPEDVVIRNEYLGWVVEQPSTWANLICLSVPRLLPTSYVNK